MGDELAGRLRDVYRDLHAHPELSFQEHRTAGIAAGWLKDLGFEVIEGIAATGVAGVLRNGGGPAVLLRADMDALPVREATGLAHASGVDGVMHACGHDMHVTCLLGAASELAASRAGWSGTVVGVFQPAEELTDGAASMVADRLFERVPRPDVVLGQHVAPIPAGAIGLRAGPMFAAADTLRITLYGAGGHGSRPETTVDPIVMAAATVMRLQGIVAREVSATDTAVVTVGAVHAGRRTTSSPTRPSCCCPSGPPMRRCATRCSRPSSASSAPRPRPRGRLGNRWWSRQGRPPRWSMMRPRSTGRAARWPPSSARRR